MPYIPKSSREDSITRLLKKHHKRTTRGKVRDSYDLPGNLRAVDATLRLSVFDIVVPGYVPGKGPELNTTNVYWTTEFAAFPNDIIASGAAIDEYLDQECRGNPSVQSRVSIIRREDMLDGECIPRGYLTGSVLKEYRQSGTVCGIAMPPGLHDGSKLPEPIFTTSTKAKIGHDVNETFDQFAARVGSDVAEAARLLSMTIYREATAIAAKVGIIIADTKFEFGIRRKPGMNTGGFELVWCDERLTPDSSRFWDETEYNQAQALEDPKSPAGWDKQPLRDYFAGILTPFGIPFSKLNNDNDIHMDWVAGIRPPQDRFDRAGYRYHRITERLIGMDGWEYRRKVMGVADEQMVTV